MSLKFAVVGHGFIGPRHVGLLNSMSDTRCVAVCDTDPLRLKDLDPSIRAYSSMDDLLRKEELDGIVIATPNKHHKPQVLQAIEAGLHVLCEKPVALSVADFDEMNAAAKRKGVIFTAHHQRRFDRDFMTARALYESGTLGDTYLVKSQLYGYNGYMHDWHVWASEGGGMMYDWGVHLIDQILLMTNSPLQSVYADVRNVVNEEVDDYFKILLRFENRLTAEIELGTYLLSDKPDWFPRHWYLAGSKGTAYIDGFEPLGAVNRTTRLLTQVRNEAGQYCGPTRSFGLPDDDLIVTETLPQVEGEAADFYRNFIATLREEAEILVKPEELRQVLEVMEAVHASSASGRSVSF